MALYYTEDPVSALVAEEKPEEPVKKLTIKELVPGNYIFKIFGTGDGAYTVDMEWLKADGTQNLTTSFTGTATPSLSETYRISYSPTGEASLSQTNQSPVANAGADQTVEQSYEVSLDGSASSDPDGDPLKYSWSFISRPPNSVAAISNAGTAKPTFTPDLPGTYVLQLVVNDYFTDSSPSTVSVTVTPLTSRISVTPNFSQPLSAGSTAISFDVNNIGTVGISSGRIELTLKDPASTVVASGSQSFGLAFGQSASVTVPATIPPLKFGNYTLTYTQSDETKTGVPASTTISNSAVETFSFDQTSYSVRNTANLTLNLINTGKFNIDNTTLTVSTPDFAYTNSQNVSIGQGQNLPYQFSIPIPSTAYAGLHTVTATLTSASGSSTTQNARMVLRNSALLITIPDATQYRPGDSFTVTIENQGSIDTTFSAETLSLTDNKGNVIYNSTASGAIMAGEKKTLVTIQLPWQQPTGLFLFKITIKDTKTGIISNYSKSLTISGGDFGVIARTEKDVYQKTESISAISSVSNKGVAIENGSLKIAVNKYKKAAGGNFVQYLPENLFPIGHPQGIAVGPDGSVYVADYDNHHIQRFDSSGNFISKWGNLCAVDSNGNGCNGLFNHPVFWLTVNWTFSRFEIHYLERRKVHAKEATQLHARGEGRHTQASPGRTGSYIGSVRQVPSAANGFLQLTEAVF